MLGFFSVDITIDEKDWPWLIEINGSNSGFDGFSLAYEDDTLIEQINAGFSELIGDKDVFVVTRLVNLGEIPIGYLDKLPRDCLLLKSMMNVHWMFPHGTVGTTWARTRADRPPATMGAGSSLNALVGKYPRFKEVMLDVADPSSVIPAEHFNDRDEAGIITFKDSFGGTVRRIRVMPEDILWFRCPTLGYAEPIRKGVQVNQEFPYDAVADNKLLTYEVLSSALGENLPLWIPVGNRCSGSSVLKEFLGRAQGDLFIRKSLMGSQARGVEILHRRDIDEYQQRIVALEQANHQQSDCLPLELRGVAEFLQKHALSFDLTLISELRLSKPIYCRVTGRKHHGCMRALALVKRDKGGSADVRFLGGYWRLARVPVDGDGFLWERYVGSQSQGAFCERVSQRDRELAEKFVKHTLTTFTEALDHLPGDRPTFEEWGMNYWMERYRAQVPSLKQGKAWTLFMAERDSAQREIDKLKEEAERLNFRSVPTNFLRAFNETANEMAPSSLVSRFHPLDQVRRIGLPYLIRDTYRIVLPEH